ncbi:hypothetical protein THAOC_35216, partial [Thalassiosira oceanica]
MIAMMLSCLGAGPSLGAASKRRRRRRQTKTTSPRGPSQVTAFLRTTERLALAHPRSGEPSGS